MIFDFPGARWSLSFPMYINSFTHLDIEEREDIVSSRLFFDGSPRRRHSLSFRLPPSPTLFNTPSSTLRFYPCARSDALWLPRRSKRLLRHSKFNFPRCDGKPFDSLVGFAPSLPRMTSTRNRLSFLYLVEGPESSKLTPWIKGRVNFDQTSKSSPSISTKADSFSNDKPSHSFSIRLQSLPNLNSLLPPPPRRRNPS